MSRSSIVAAVVALAFLFNGIHAAASGPSASGPSASGHEDEGCQPFSKPGGGTWRCTFSDEFDGNSLNRNYWEVIPYGLGNTCQSDDPEHVQVSDGNLRLLASRNSTSDWCYQEYGLEYTGGFIQTQGRFAQRFGRFEMRARLPAGEGAWPAFWLLPDDESYDGEIDILEAYGGRLDDQGRHIGDFTLHVPAGGPGPQRTCPITPDYSTDFHTYTLEWSANRMRALYDGVVCANFTGDNDDGTGGFSPTFTTKPYHILLDLAAQDWWPPTSDTEFPLTMDVDYVRVWR